MGKDTVPSLISLVVSVDVKHYVYLLTMMKTPTRNWKHGRSIVLEERKCLEV